MATGLIVLGVKAGLEALVKVDLVALSLLVVLNCELGADVVKNWL